MDLNIMLTVMMKFDFIYPIVCVMIHNGLKSYITFVLTQSISLTAFSIASSIVATIILACGMMLDAAVFMTISSKRISLVLVLFSTVSLAVMEHISANDSSDPTNFKENQICFPVLFSSCASVLAIQSMCFRIAAIFYAKMLYLSFRYPSRLMLMTNYMEYKARIKSDALAASPTTSTGITSNPVRGV
jgi:hypothetical protein